MHTQLTLIIAVHCPEVYGLVLMPSNLVDLYLWQIQCGIADERLRQARYSFNSCMIATTISFLLCLVGAGLLLSNKVPEGAVTAASAMVSNALFVQLAKDANDRLDKIVTGLTDSKYL